MKNILAEGAGKVDDEPGVVIEELLEFLVPGLVGWIQR